jgi:hypothetical protein
MAFLEVERIRITDPLSDETRKIRKALLGISAASIAIVHMGLLPTKISALGIDFSASDRNALLVVLTLIVGYFLIAFIIYAFADFVAWRLNRSSTAYEIESSDYEKARQSILQGKRELTKEEEEELQMINTSEGNIWRGAYIKDDMWAAKVVPPVSVVRALFDFIVPVPIAIYAIIILIWAAQRL